MELSYFSSLLFLSPEIFIELGEKVLGKKVRVTYYPDGTFVGIVSRDEKGRLIVVGPCGKVGYIKDAFEIVVLDE